MSLVERAIKKLQASGAPPGVELKAKPGAAADGPNTHHGLSQSSVAEMREQSAKVPTKPVPRKRIQLDRTFLRTEGLLPPQHHEREIADDYRQIKRPLLGNALGKVRGEIPHGRCIMVASALSGEGKTFTSFNLALSIARERELSVVLIDADIPKRHISRVLGLSDEPGLIDVLMSESLDAASLLIETDVPNFAILPAGHQSETATELLASRRMQQVVADLCAEDPHRILLLDSSPLLLTSESRVLSAVAGQVVLVVRAESTAQQAVLDAINFLGSHECLSLVLNACRTATRHDYYYGSQAPYGVESTEQ